MKTLIRNANVWQKGKFLTKDVLVDGERIAVVGKLPEETQCDHEVDGTGKFLLPGVIDCHAHSTMVCGTRHMPDFFASSDAELTLDGAINAEKMVRCGITTIRDCGGRRFETLAVRDYINKGKLIGPRMLCSGTPLKVVFALIIALILNHESKAVPIYRATYYLPSIIGGSVAVSVMWRNLFTKAGVINSLLQAVGIDCRLNWLSNTKTALFTLILLYVWQFGSSMLIFLSGLKQIPVSYYEAAEVDGAGKVRQFFSITLPLLSPIILFNLVMQIINGFMVFTQAQIITDGGPVNETLVYILYLYQNSFKYYEMGYGSAMAWILLVIVGFFTALVFKSSSQWVFYENNSDMAGGKKKKGRKGGRKSS